MSGRAFGKVILLGEHAVVYGVPAIAAGIDRGAFAEVESAAERSMLSLAGAGEVVADDHGSDVSRAFAAVLRASGTKDAVRVRAMTELPAGAGLGCSAALGVAIARALAARAGDAIDAGTAAERAMAWERVFHGNPSGIDATVAAMGGCIAFTRGKAPETVRVKTPLRLVVGHSGMPSSTKSMVESVAKLREKRSEQVGKTFEGIASLVQNARLAIEAGDVVGLGKLLDLNQMLLAGLFLSTTEIERMCDLARKAGALGAKLTGAGGGGCVVALVQSDPSAVLEAWRREGFDAFATTVEGSNAGAALDAAMAG